MALVSKQQLIAQAQRVAAIADTDLNIVTYGVEETFSMNQLPAALMTFDSAKPHTYTSQCQDIIVHQVWAVFGRDADEVSVILEKLLWLFYKPSVRTTLSALGFVGYEMTNLIPAQPMQGQNMTKQIGIVEFDVRIKIANQF